jgi:hypothetical protein
MKTSTIKNNGDLLNRIEAIEKDVRSLKLTILKKFSPPGRKIVKLKGILKGKEISDEDITQAQKSLYSKVNFITQ